MSKRDALIEKYAEDLKTKIGVTPDMDLLARSQSAVARLFTIKTRLPYLDLTSQN